ncbi:MAG TPA: penicillin acylase family protein [Allosphingosinicella sp.]|jgi:acyl-homoserine-lactone acylase|nr:penicillin acylase family protein [Allosphingosinicella sp.]
MRFLLLAALLLAGACASTRAENPDRARWRAQAERVTIARDDWGIAHVRGETDADAVFGMIYAQAEDDFNRIETNYLTALGRTAEAEGEKAIWADLRARLYMDPADLQARYRVSPEWLRGLMDAWADGLNYYLATHPEVRPRAITRFEPWMALSFTEGSIGGDIERIDLDALEAFYTRPSSQRGLGPQGAKSAEFITPRAPRLRRRDEPDPDRRGSNGIAIAPRNSAGGHALLLINPHTSFFFRSELQVTSGEGLNAYGAATWGQFFIYQGFNENVGWMHTSSGVDVVDEFLETVEQKEGGLFYHYGNELRPVATRTIAIPYRAADGTMASRTFETYRTHHGPIVREAGGKWVAFAMMHKPVEALQQSFGRTKARDFASFLSVAELKANSSNNTVFASAKGEIAYLHPQFIPVRDDRFDYTKPVDGSDPRTDWRGLHALAETPQVLDPPSGWIQNTNNWPYSAAGPHSPRQRDHPRYMDMFGETPRGLQAVRLLREKRQLTLEGLRDAAYDSYQTAFARLIPGLVAAWDRAAASNPLKRRLDGPVAALRGWDYRWGSDSVPTTLAMAWGEHLWAEVKKDGQPPMVPIDLIDALPAQRKLEALAAVSEQLERDFGRWAVPWGELNRFQRLTGDIVQPFSDARPSLPVGFTSGRWGSLASFAAAPRNGSKRWYGTSGNSFVAVVEFGPRVRALAVTAGGESGHPGSPHFNDQAGRYATGDLREVYFYPDQLKGHTERSYRPGR